MSIAYFFTVVVIFSETLKFTEPRVHAVVYEPTTGELNRLQVDFDELIQDLREVYGLYAM